MAATDSESQNRSSSFKFAVSSDSRELENLIKSGIQARGFGIIENETHSDLPLNRPGLIGDCLV